MNYIGFQSVTALAPIVLDSGVSVAGTVRDTVVGPLVGIPIADGDFLDARIDEATGKVILFKKSTGLEFPR